MTELEAVQSRLLELRHRERAVNAEIDDRKKELADIQRLPHAVLGAVVVQGSLLDAV